jgi:hypothetical protein
LEAVTEQPLISKLRPKARINQARKATLKRFKKALAGREKPIDKVIRDTRFDLNALRRCPLTLQPCCPQSLEMQLATLNEWQQLTIVDKTIYAMARPDICTCRVRVPD